MSSTNGDSRWATSNYCAVAAALGTALVASRGHSAVLPVLLYSGAGYALTPAGSTAQPLLPAQASASVTNAPVMPASAALLPAGGASGNSSAVPPAMSISPPWGEGVPRPNSMPVVTVRPAAGPAA